MEQREPPLFRAAGPVAEVRKLAVNGLDLFNECHLSLPRFFVNGPGSLRQARAQITRPLP
jgi:hypothetical protein